MRDLIYIKGKDKAKINKGFSLSHLFLLPYTSHNQQNILETEISCYVHVGIFNYLEILLNTGK